MILNENSLAAEAAFRPTPTATASGTQRANSNTDSN